MRNLKLYGGLCLLRHVKYGFRAKLLKVILEGGKFVGCCIAVASTHNLHAKLKLN